jgi:hypothetical protein
MGTSDGLPCSLAGEFNVAAAILAAALDVTFRLRHWKFDVFYPGGVQSAWGQSRPAKELTQYAFAFIGQRLYSARMENLFPLESSWAGIVPASLLAVFMLWLLSKTLPVQNILMIAACILAGEALTDFLFAHFLWIEVDGPLWIYVSGAAVLWLGIVLGGRKLAQLILEPWRREKVYGYWVIGIGAVFVGMFQFGWPSINPDPIPESRAGLMALIRGAATIVFLFALSPWFIRKRPVSNIQKSELAQEPENKTQ